MTHMVEWVGGIHTSGTGEYVECNVGTWGRLLLSHPTKIEEESVLKK